MRRGIPLSVRFRRFNGSHRNCFTGQTRIHYFAGRLLTVDRVLTNAAVLAVVMAALVRIVVGLIGVRIIKPLIAVVAGSRAGCEQRWVSGEGCADKTRICIVGKP